MTIIPKPPGTFFIVDVFAERTYSGNQLAVFPPTREYSSEEMQLIAREMHFSETTFITSDRTADGGYPTRIFTPDEELPFAGHPMLGTAFVLRNYLLGAPTDEVSIALRDGLIPVRWESIGTESIPFMKQFAPTFGDTIPRRLISEILNVDECDFDDRFPIQNISTGIPWCIVPLRSLMAVQRCTLLKQGFSSIYPDFHSVGIMIFAAQTLDTANDIHARVFTGMQSIPEDPATGSANGCLAAYLSRYAVLGSASVSARVEQGFEIKRESILHLRATPNGDTIDIHVGGKVIGIAEGNLL